MKLHEKLELKLNASKFRFLNQQMSKKKLNLSKSDISAYHTGYSQQVYKWPINPLTLIIKDIKTVENKKIADLGCGEALIASSVTNNEIYSYDKYPINDNIIKADICKIPVENNYFDIVVCCLSMMKSDITCYIKECNRILTIGGIMYIAEVASRINDIKDYVHGIQKMGFKKLYINKTNKYFLIFKFEKTEESEVTNLKIELKKYMYKKR